MPYQNCKKKEKDFCNECPYILKPKYNKIQLNRKRKSLLEFAQNEESILKI